MRWRSIKKEMLPPKERVILATKDLTHLAFYWNELGCSFNDPVNFYGPEGKVFASYFSSAAYWLPLSEFPAPVCSECNQEIRHERGNSDQT